MEERNNLSEEKQNYNDKQKTSDFPLGAVLLDLDEHDLPNIVTRVVDHMVACDQLPSDQRDAVIKTLLIKYKNDNDNPNVFKRSTSGSTRASTRESKRHLHGTAEEKVQNINSTTNFERSSIRKSINNIFHLSAFTSSKKKRSNGDREQLHRDSGEYGIDNNGAQIDYEGENESSDPTRKISDLPKNFSDGSEATAVFVGTVDFLKKPTIAFVRLTEGVVMDNVIEVAVPVRFLYILLGPFQGEKDYHDLGHSISSLMSDKAFHEVAYRATSRDQLLTAMNAFLKPSVVNGSSNWKHQDLIPYDDGTDKKLNLSQRRDGNRDGAHCITVHAKDDDHGKKPPRDPLKRVGKPFYGLIQDVKCRYSQYWSDIKDGLSPQVVSATIFIFFAALSPAITFGGMYADQTDKYIGVGETLLVSSICGVIFALFAAQPLLIVGATGPLMIFDMSLLSFCNSSGIDYLSLRAWVGIWILLIGFLVAAFEVVSIVKYFTRFTEEIFSTLVCIIFIYGAFEKLASIFQAHPLGSSTTGFRDINNTEIDVSDMLFDDLNITEGLTDGLLINGTLHNSTNILGDEVDDSEILVNQPNTALLSMCLMLGTFIIAFKLKKFRNSKFLGRSVRRAIGDFGVPISILMMVTLDYFIRDTYTDKLTMPKGLQPSNAAIRGWLINPFGVVTPLPLWCIFAAGPAALLLFILIFLEENICHLILSKPERCLKKGTGFHLDIFLSCLINTICGFLGAPFMGPACVRTIAHMSALTVMGTNAPGGSPKIVGCIEQRVSALIVSLLVGLAVMLYAALNLVPIAVLSGIFLYMGISATAGIQFLERIVLFFMPVKHHYDTPYVKKVATRKMHLFTVVQLIVFIILWIVKQSPASLCVPFILICLIPLRIFLLPYIFSSAELVALDGVETPEPIAEEEEPDFYETAHGLPTQIQDTDDGSRAQES